MIKQIELPSNDRYLQTILLSDLDVEEIEDRKKIKEMMFNHIDKVTVNRVMKGNHKCVEITITSKTKLTFVFLYDSWLNAHRKGECNLFYEDKPVYEIDGAIIRQNEGVQKMLYQKIGLPELTSKELGEAAIRYAKAQQQSQISIKIQSFGWIFALFSYLCG